MYARERTHKNAHNLQGICHVRVECPLTNACQLCGNWMECESFYWYFCWLIWYGTAENCAWSKDGGAHFVAQSSRFAWHPLFSALFRSWFHQHHENVRKLCKTTAVRQTGGSPGGCDRLKRTRIFDAPGVEIKFFSTRFLFVGWSGSRVLLANVRN